MFGFSVIFKNPEQKQGNSGTKIKTGTNHSWIRQIEHNLHTSTKWRMTRWEEGVWIQRQQIKKTESIGWRLSALSSSSPSPSPPSSLAIVEYLILMRILSKTWTPGTYLWTVHFTYRWSVEHEDAIMANSLTGEGTRGHLVR